MTKETDKLNKRQVAFQREKHASMSSKYLKIIYRWLSYYAWRWIKNLWLCLVFFLTVKNPVWFARKAVSPDLWHVMWFDNGYLQTKNVFSGYRLRVTKYSSKSFINYDTFPDLFLSFLTWTFYHYLNLSI